jgi:hypothetical protein
LIYVVRDLAGVAKFKIVQESRDQTRVLLVFAAEADRRAVVERIKTGMADRLGSGVRIEIEVVDDIPLETSGKYRYVTSNVPVPHT